MKQLKHSLITFVAALAIACVIAISNSSTAYGQKPDPLPPPISVKVVNTLSEPVPVTGSVNVSNPVTVSGSVNVSNPVTVSGTVNVGNTVSFKPAIPDGAFSLAVAGDLNGVIFRDEGATNYAITSMTAFNDGSNPGLVQLFGSAASLNVPCNQGVIQALGPIVNVRPGETVHLTFPQPFIVRVGGPISCLIKTGDSIQLMLVGYKF